MSNLRDAGDASTPRSFGLMEANRLSSAWWLATALCACLLILLVPAYWPTVKSIVNTWLRSETFTHGILILPISGFMIWTRRAALIQVTPKPLILGVVVIATLGMIWLLGNVADVLLLEQLALVAMIPAVILTVLGRQVVGMLVFPLAYLMFAVPFGEFLIPPLMDFTAWFSVKAIRLSGVPVFWEGRYITMPTGSWVVAEVCSGLRYLIASLAVGCLFAYLNYRSYWRRLAFIVLATIVPIVANGLRAYGIIMLGHLSNMKLATGVDHIIYGWVFFGVVILLLFWLGTLWREPISENSTTSSASRNITGEADEARYPSKTSFISVFLAAIVAISIGPLAAATLVNGSTQAMQVSVILPDGAGGWSGPVETTDSWQPKFSGDREELHRVYLDGSTPVHVFVIHYGTQKQGSELIGSGNHIYDGKQWQRVSERPVNIQLANGKNFQVVETIMRSGLGKRLVWHWYDISGRQTTSKIEGKLWGAWHRLVGPDTGSSLVMVATDFEFQPEEPRRTLERFLSENPELTRPGELMVMSPQ